MKPFAIAFAVGLASALLFASIDAGSPFAVLLSYLGALPIMIVAMGWNQRAGLGAVLVATCVIAAVLRPVSSLVYAVGWGLPGWWIGYLALLGRPVGAEAETPSGSPWPSLAPAPARAGVADVTEWYPPGRLLFWIAGLAAAITLAGTLAIGGLDHDAFHRILSTVVEAVLRRGVEAASETPIPQIAGIDAARIVRILVAVIPLIAGASFTLVFVFNAWCAARVVAISGRLARPWPELPTTRMPAASVGLLACATIGMLAPGFVGVAAAALAGALGMASALQGLAFLHATTLVRPGPGGSRGVMLGAVYLLTILFGGTMLPLLSLVGILDCATPMRRRLALPSSRTD